VFRAYEVFGAYEGFEVFGVFEAYEAPRAEARGY
jgi:hypothetical protein